MPCQPVTFISSMTYSETRPNRPGWHGTVTSRASEGKCITSVRQMARISFHFYHFTMYNVCHSFSFFRLLLDFLLLPSELTEPLEATHAMSSRPHCFLSSDPLSPSLPVSSRSRFRWNRTPLVGFTERTRYPFTHEARGRVYLGCQGYSCMGRASGQAVGTSISKST